MANLALAGLIFALGTAQDVPGPEDRWISGASPLHMIVDPCDPTVQGEDGVSISWVRSALLERGHARDLVCGAYTDPASTAAIPAEASADLLDLWAQVMGRSMVMMGSVSRPLDDDGSWGKKSEEGSRALYLHLKADGYRALRELQTLEAAPPPAPQ